jgi:hypothetical protein
LTSATIAPSHVSGDRWSLPFIHNIGCNVVALRPSICVRVNSSYAVIRSMRSLASLGVRAPLP